MTPTQALDLQRTAGLVNLWIWPACVWAVGTGVFSQLEPWLGLFGWAGCLLVPVGFLEVFLSTVARHADAPVLAARRLARLQVAAALLGGLPSAWVGLRVLSRLQTPYRS